MSIGAEVGAGEDVAVEVDRVGWRGLCLDDGGQEEDCAEGEGFHEVECIRLLGCSWMHTLPTGFCAKYSNLGL